VRNPALEPLDVLVGEWTLTLTDAWFLESRTVRQHGHATARRLGDAVIEVETSRTASTAQIPPRCATQFAGRHLVVHRPERIGGAQTRAVTIGRSVVLHDVFQYPFDAVTEIVGRSPAAYRQLASRARRTITAEARPARCRVETSEQRLVTERFLAACTTGDIDGLMAVLDPDVAGGADVGGRVGRVVQTGCDAVTAAAMRFLGPDSRTTLLTLGGGGETGIIAVGDGQLVTSLTITVRRGLIHHIDGIADPVKLARSPAHSALQPDQEGRTQRWALPLRRVPASGDRAKHTPISARLSSYRLVRT
jgi:hypothetical protein